MELKSSEKRSIIYHSIFNYPLSQDNLKKWLCKDKFNFKQKETQFKKINDYYVLKGQENNIKKRIENERSSKKKLLIAQKAAKLISKIPTVLFIGITGSLAMMSANKNSDIDLLIIIKNDKLWTTRLFVYLILKLSSFNLRKPNDRNEKDKLCINMWLSESDLTWSKKDRNIYTAHEIAQVVPIYNKNETYEKFLYLNNWILKFWPNSTQIKKIKVKSKKEAHNVFEKIAFYVQYKYMQKRISKETVTLKRALFHPRDNSLHIISLLNDSTH